MKKAAKICAGEYEYRGWAISKIATDWGGAMRDEWYIAATTVEQGRSHFDPVPTLRDAKRAIDWAIDEGHV